MSRMLSRCHDVTSGGRDTEIARDNTGLDEIAGEISELLDICDINIREADTEVVRAGNNVVNQELFIKQLLRKSTFSTFEICQHS